MRFQSIIEQAKFLPVPLSPGDSAMYHWHMPKAFTYLPYFQFCM